VVAICQPIIRTVREVGDQWDEVWIAQEGVYALISPEISTEVLMPTPTPILENTSRRPASRCMRTFASSERHSRYAPTYDTCFALWHVSILVG
jgi:hypothetical protein